MSFKLTPFLSLALACGALATACGGSARESQDSLSSADCAAAVASPAILWPPDHRMAGVSVVGLGDGVRVDITGMTQDEPVNDVGDGNTAPDATLSPVEVRRERAGVGNGRVYAIHFTAEGASGSCSGQVTVCVPHDRGHGASCVDDGQDHDATCATGSCSCTPTRTCASAEAVCGPVDDGCGHALDCGTCDAAQVCRAGQCCQPATCESLEQTCGEFDDGCGGVLTCSFCA